MVRLLRIVSITLVSLAALALSDTAWAQPGPGGGGRGMGMGMMRGGFNPSLSMMYPMLLNSPTVQKDLDLLDEQKAKIKEANDKSRAAMREIGSSMGDMSDLTDKERQAKWQEMGKKMQAQTKETNKLIEAALLPDQLKRLKGLALQAAGVMALSDKDVQKQLKLSDDQVAKIKSTDEDSMKKMGELFRSGGDRDAMRKKMDEMRKETEKKKMDVLTADQKTALEKMKGKKLEIPASELRMPGFGGGGRRGGGGQGGGGGGADRPTD